MKWKESNAQDIAKQNYKNIETKDQEVHPNMSLGWHSSIIHFNKLIGKPQRKLLVQRT